MDLAQEFETARLEGMNALGAAPDVAALEEVRVKYLGRQGVLKELTRRFGEADGSQKRVLGPLLSALKDGLTQALETRQAALSTVVGFDPIDISLPVESPRLGSIHPLAQAASLVEDVFHGLGFTVVDGPHVEEDSFNFTRLNIPEDHPAREAHDTFWLTDGHLLRTHTSAVQPRIYSMVKPPMRRVVIGKVFRYEEVDATHDNTFSQVEGFIIDKDINVGHMVATIKAMIGGVLDRPDIEIRLRPSYFPFVEPGFEVDVRTPGASGPLGRWMELLGCGMIHPRVLSMSGIDPSQWQGFAFGMGLERLVMMRHGITDIRVFNGADLRSLRQFA
jgi:phenylalanyl-tRNA synthetase alpha chain